MNEEKKDEKVTTSTSTSASESVDMSPVPPTDDIGRGVFSKLSETAAGVKMKLKKYATDIKNKIRISYTSPEKLADRLNKIIGFLNDLQPKKDAHMKKIEEYRKKIVELETLEDKFKKDPTANPVEIMNELQEQEKPQQEQPQTQQEQVQDNLQKNSQNNPTVNPAIEDAHPFTRIRSAPAAFPQTTYRQNMPPFPQPTHNAPQNVPQSREKTRQSVLEVKRRWEELARENFRLRQKLETAKNIPAQVKVSSSQSAKRRNFFKPKTVKRLFQMQV